MDGKFAIDQDNCAFRIVDGEAVLIHSETTFYYGLNEVGTKVWQMLLDSDVTVDEVAWKLHGDSGEPPAELVAATAAFLGELANEQFLTKGGGVTAGHSDPTTPLTAPDAPDWMPQINKYDSLDELIITGE